MFESFTHCLGTQREGRKFRRSASCTERGSYKTTLRFPQLSVLALADDVAKVARGSASPIGIPPQHPIFRSVCRLEREEKLSNVRARTTTARGRALLGRRGVVVVGEDVASSLSSLFGVSVVLSMRIVGGRQNITEGLSGAFIWRVIPFSRVMKFDCAFQTVSSAQIFHTLGTRLNIKSLIPAAPSKLIKHQFTDYAPFTCHQKTQTKVV